MKKTLEEQKARFHQIVGQNLIMDGIELPSKPKEDNRALWDIIKMTTTQN